MATGGAIPISRDQTVTFFNTSGVIDKSHNMYFFPKLTVPTGTIPTTRNAFIYALRTQCPPPTDYDTIQLSGWSPEDRQLVVKGNIEDFRATRTQSAGSDRTFNLNYCLIHRTIHYENNVNHEFWYGFFIDKAKQAGGSSVRLVLSPDHFTNVFFLLNWKYGDAQTLLDYDPFNDSMKNCIVERQHYNRIRKWRNSIYPANTDVFLNNQEPVNYNYQYRDLKYPISNLYKENFTKSEMEAIEQATTVVDLETSLVNKILGCCITWLVIELKSTELLANYLKISNTTGSHPTFKINVGAGNMENQEGVYRPNIVISYPMFSVPEQFKKFNFDAQDYRLNILGDTSQMLIDGREVLTVLNTKALADYVYSAYIVRDIMLDFNDIEFTYSYNSSLNKTVVNIDFISTSAPAGTSEPASDLTYTRYFADRVQIAGLLTNPQYIGSYDSDKCIVTYFNQGARTYDFNYPRVLTGLVLNGIEGKEYYLVLSDYIPSSLIEEYYDPMLEKAPYQFYSVSTYSSYELIFEKNRCFGEFSFNGQVYLDYFLSINGVVKESYIPKYTVEDSETMYFNEGLVMTLPLALPLASDSYSTYYYRNMSSMKAQYMNMSIQNSSNLINSGISGTTETYARMTEDKWSGAGKALAVSEVGGGDDDSMYASLVNTGFTSAGHMFAGNIRTLGGMINEGISGGSRAWQLRNTIEAKKADVGRAPDSLSQTASDVYYSLKVKEDSLYLNHYKIDSPSYQRACKYFERFGYTVNRYDTLNVNDRKGWNYIKCNSFDYVKNINLEQESAIRQIFANGVTLLHDKSYLTSGHNYETILDS